MPTLNPFKLTKQLIDKTKEVLRRELGLPPKTRGPPGSQAEILLRAREAVHQDPPKLVNAVYQAEDAEVPTERKLECYSLRPGAGGSGQLLYAYCHKDAAIEAFRLDRFKNFQVTEIPFSPKWDIEL